ncbi:MAG TPA: hypothetical protein VK894_12995 [Jiangellales bacterium]|nr:hypothetical protein [Jiangellales bacterium]
MTRDDGRDDGPRPAGDEQQPSDDEVWAGLVASFEASGDDPVGRWPASEDVDDVPGDETGAGFDGGTGVAGEHGDRAGSGDPGDPGDVGEAGEAGDAGPREGRVLRPVLGAPFGTPAAPAPPVPPGQADPPGHGVPPGQARDDEGHYVPPPPPPIPRGDAVSRGAWAGALGGPAVLMIAAVLGVGLPSWVVGLCVAGFVVGFATLVVRLRGHDPYDPDDGAVV